MSIISTRRSPLLLPGLVRALLTAALLVPATLAVNTGCKPKAVRGGEGTENPNLDNAAMSTTLDRKDLEDLLKVNLDKLFASPWWGSLRSVEKPAVVAIWPFKNETSQHIDDQLNTLLGQMETQFVNSGVVNVVSRERQAEMAREVQVQQNANIYDPNYQAQVSRQVGADYYITGKVGSVDEMINGERRVQYTLFVQVIEIETSLVKFQAQSERTKAIVR
ncbi:MAG: penicillin-binding protein activator LpoB [Myxococcales bacterium]|nr:penicillin-binding protein activator LpoB [Myxococcales bacterium]MCB9749530.1 penicillin-binding protein activator LpoB [Myxococcales bacterium]